MKTFIKSLIIKPFSLNLLLKPIITVIILALALYSCEQDTEGNNFPSPDQINSVTLSPKPDQILCFGQEIIIPFSYRVSQAGGARIFIRPMSLGSLTSNYAASPSKLYTGEGVDSVKFTIISGTESVVDQLRIQILNADQSELISESFINVNYIFSDLSIKTSLPSPVSNTLCFNQDVPVPFQYNFCNNQQVRIFVRPFTNGSLSPNYSASASPLYSGNGLDTAYFTITGEQSVHVDSIRIRIYNADQSVLLKEYFEEVDFLFGSSAQINNLMPESPKSLKYNDKVNIGFKYNICAVEGARIFVRPFTNGALSPHYAASGSPIFYASGLSTAEFTLTEGDSSTTVDSLRIQIYNKDQTTLLHESFVPVSYTFE